MRNWLVLYPARLIDLATRTYAVLLAAVAIVTFTTAGLWGLLWALGYPLP